MDATRARRTRDQARQGWYARYRQCRFARYLGFADGPEATLPVVAAYRLSLKDRTTGPCQGRTPLGRDSMSPTAHRHDRAVALAAG